VPREGILVKALFRGPTPASSIATVFQKEDRDPLGNESFGQIRPVADVTRIAVEKQDFRGGLDVVGKNLIPPGMDSNTVRSDEKKLLPRHATQDRWRTGILPGREEENAFREGR
jgi:hypothetical protein